MRDVKDAFIAVLHQSNLDLGWPVQSRGARERNRNGVFASYTYKFNRR